MKFYESRALFELNHNLNPNLYIADQTESPVADSHDHSYGPRDIRSFSIAVFANTPIAHYKIDPFEMLRTYLRSLKPLLPPSRPGRIASELGRQIPSRSFFTQIQSNLRSPTSSKASQQLLTTRTRVSNALKKPSASPLRATRRSFHNTSRARNSKPNARKTNADEPQGLSARLKKLSREYGWSALGVYLSLSVLDFPFCFLLVRIVGTDRIGEFEHLVVSNVKKLIPESVRERWHEYRKALKDAEQEHLGNDNVSEHVEMAGWGVEEAEKRNKAEASLGTQLALAYAIHKSFIFIRVPLTAAVTPKVVKVLRSWGWNIGKRRSKPS
ncbi:peptide alpha-N-acetyltransferase Nat2 [Camillea tinctor]|nr:peptide alpha-N-acetyltransferase Nat2 [Camillea tinctor]